MSNLRKITAIVADENKATVRKSENGNHFVVVDCDACIEGNTLLPAKRSAFFADKALLEKVKVGMSIELD